MSDRYLITVAVILATAFALALCNGEPSKTGEVCKPDGDGGFNIVNGSGKTILHSRAGSGIINYSESDQMCYRGGEPESGVPYRR